MKCILSGAVTALVVITTLSFGIPASFCDALMPDYKRILDEIAELVAQAPDYMVFEGLNNAQRKNVGILHNIKTSILQRVETSRDGRPVVVWVNILPEGERTAFANMMGKGIGSIGREDIEVFLGSANSDARLLFQDYDSFIKKHPRTRVVIIGPPQDVSFFGKFKNAVYKNIDWCALQIKKLLGRGKRQFDFSILLNAGAPGIAPGSYDFQMDWSKEARLSSEQIEFILQGNVTVRKIGIARGDREADVLKKKMLEALKENPYDKDSPLTDRVVWTGITANTETADVPDDDENNYVIISVGDTILRPIEWELERDETDLPFMRMREAVMDMLFKDGARAISEWINDAAGRAVDIDREVKWIWIDRHNEGPQAGIFKVTVCLEDGQEFVFGIISAKNPDSGSAAVETDYKNLSAVYRLYEDFNSTHGKNIPHETPKVYAGGYGRSGSPGQEQRVYMFMSQWILGSYGFRPYFDTSTGTIYALGMDREIPSLPFSLIATRRIIQRVAMTAATIFELTGGKIPIISFMGGDAVVNLDERRDIGNAMLTTLDLFSSDPGHRGMIKREGARNLARTLIRLYSLDTRKPEDKSILFFLLLLNIKESIDLFSPSEPVCASLQICIFYHPNILFAGVTDALIRMYGERPGLEAAIGIFEKFAGMNTPYRTYAGGFLQILKRRMDTCSTNLVYSSV